MADGYFIPPGWKVDEYVEALSAVDSMGRPLFVRLETDEEYARMLDAWTRLYDPERDLASAVYYQPGGMQPAVQLSGAAPDPSPEKRTLAELSALIQAYLAADVMDPTATIEFLLKASLL